MQSINLTIGKRNLRTFQSFSQLSAYCIDILIRLSIFGGLAISGIVFLFIETSTSQLSAYILLYLLAIFNWGLLLAKYILCGKQVFGKTKFDLFFMGFLFLSLISVLISKNRMYGVFGVQGTWSYSIITFLSISILYYVVTQLFKYPRGIKWLSFAYILSLFIPSVYYISYAVRSEYVGSLDFLSYAVLSIPLIISSIFVFRKILLRIFAFITLIGVLFLVAFYANFLQGSMFVLSIGVLVLFVLFYISFWVKNARTLTTFITKLFRNVGRLKKVITENKKAVFLLLIVIFMALWIIGFSSFSFTYFKKNFGDSFFRWFGEDLQRISGLKSWLMGDNNLSRQFSTFEILNILDNYGIVCALVFVLFFASVIVKTGKMTLKLLYTASWRNITFVASMFISVVSLFVVFITTRFSPMIYILLIITISFIAIISDLMEKNDLYSLLECRGKRNLKTIILKVIPLLLILGLTIFGLIGLLKGVDSGFFWGDL